MELSIIFASVSEENRTLKGSTGTKLKQGHVVTK